MANDVNDWNAQVIAEFRANDGKVEQFGDAPLLILHTIGAKSGKERLIPLVTFTDDSGKYVFASRGGHKNNPDWLFNLRANPEIKIEEKTASGIDTYRANMVELSPEDSQIKITAQGEIMEQFKQYITDAAPRMIPAIRIDRV